MPPLAPQRPVAGPQWKNTSPKVTLIWHHRWSTDTWNIRSYHFSSRPIPEWLPVTTKQPTFLFTILNSIKYMKPTFVKLAIFKCLPGDGWWTIAMENPYTSFILFQHWEKWFFHYFPGETRKRDARKSWKLKGSCSCGTITGRNIYQQRPCFTLLSLCPIH